MSYDVPAACGWCDVKIACSDKMTKSATVCVRGGTATCKGLEDRLKDSIAVRGQLARLGAFVVDDNREAFARVSNAFVRDGVSGTVDM